jgi:hypothetical protein
MTPEIVAGTIVVLVLVGWALRPLIKHRQARQRLHTSRSAQALENLLFEREVALTAIRDLQMDYAMGKLSEADFAELDARYRATAVHVIRSLDEHGVEDDLSTEEELDTWIEQAVRAESQRLRAQKQQPPVAAPETGTQGTMP